MPVPALRVLAATGLGLFAAGWIVGWFEVLPRVVGASGTVRPDGVLGGWPSVVALVALSVAVVLAVADARRFGPAAVVAAVPALAVITLAGTLSPRAVVDGAGPVEVVGERTGGQALSLLGVLVALMAVVALWRAAVAPARAGV